MTEFLLSAAIAAGISAFQYCLQANMERKTLHQHIVDDQEQRTTYIRIDRCRYCDRVNRPGYLDCAGCGAPTL